ncbi:hypothetical protein L1987_01983 [Smallanthus sonchifolius]|uniref:Uncharacterized protein n=1 Tax=Smallanthus sonchifolius TaxID=185202 RepID=A0ACB9K6I6_9ASTR|nr:hypothetical protein L1987_01983 [Smallanthus sonchifolius]
MFGGFSSVYFGPLALSSLDTRERELIDLFIQLFTSSMIFDARRRFLPYSDNDVERAHLKEQKFQQEIMMLVRLKHPRIVWFIGACCKPMLW